ncbi:MAG: hypothetical protein FWD82_09420 [Defluviitaleaceae bacterium]|nr:hypothetical protein [Defluviitaleaceae bacterium]
MRIIAQLCIDGTIEAAELYKEAFDLTLGLTVKHDDGTYAHLSLMCGDAEVLSMTEKSKLEGAAHLKGTNAECHAGNTRAFDSPVTVGIYGLTKEAVQKAYDILKKDAILFDPEGPKSLPWLELDFHIIDKFGVSWEVGT